MRLDSVEVQNFFNHKYTKIDLTATGSPILIRGENGAGKSSLMTESLTFAIFGQTRMPGADDAIRNGASEMSVAVTFNLNGQNVEILRTKKRGKSAKIQLIVDGQSTDELLSETQQRINNMFGLSYNSFLSSIILKQEEADYFVRQKPDERKKIITEILDLEAYKRLEKIAREERTNLKAEFKIEEASYSVINTQDGEVLQNKLRILNGGVKMLKDGIESKETELNATRLWNSAVQEQKRQAYIALQSNHKIEQYIKQLEQKIDANKREIQLSSSLTSQGNDYASQIEAYELQIEEVEKLLVKAQTDHTELTEKMHVQRQTVETDLRKQMEAPMRAVDEEKAMLRGLQSRIEDAEEFNHTECPTCMQMVDEAYRADVIKSMKACAVVHQEQINQLNVPLHEVTDQLKLLFNKQLDWQVKGIKKLAELEQYIAETTLALKVDRQSIKKKLDLQAEYELAKQKLGYLESQNKEHAETIEKMREQIVDIPMVEAVEKPEDNLIRAVTEAKQQYDMAIRSIANLESEIAQNEIAIQKKEKLKATLMMKVRKIQLLDKLCLAFSNKGIPAAIIATVLPEIETIANSFLKRMSHGRLSLEFKTTETQKNGNEKDTLDIAVHDSQEWRRFESFSGGEQFRISLAIRLALSKVLARRANIDLQLLILDEAATSLDQPGREEFVEIVQSLRKDFSRIILMSHIPELADNFDNTIILSRSNDGTRVITK